MQYCYGLFSCSFLCNTGMASFRVPFYAILVWQLFVFLSYIMVMISLHLPLVFNTEIASFHLSLLFNVSIFMFLPNAIHCWPLFIFIFAVILQWPLSMFFFYSISRWSFRHVPLVCSIVWASPFRVPVLSNTVRASFHVPVYLVLRGPLSMFLFI